MKRRGFTLIEILVVLAIIGIMAAILFPVFARARQKARQSACFVNMKVVCEAISLYALDSDDCLPTNPRVLGWAKAYRKIEMLNCPVFAYDNYDNHLASGFGFNLGMNVYPKFKAGSKAYLWDGRDLVNKFTPASAGWWMPDWIDWERHYVSDKDGANIGFCDGHVKIYFKPDPTKSSTTIPASFF